MFLSRRSHRLDADINFPYGDITDVESKNVIAPSYDVKWRSPDDDYKGNSSTHISTNRP
jgi:hypothetical protein